MTNLLKKAPKKIQRKLERIGELTFQAKHALEEAGKNFLGQMLNEAQKELESLGVSDAGLNRLIYFARQEGALGAKLTGGGNGGCIKIGRASCREREEISEGAGGVEKT